MNLLRSLFTVLFIASAGAVAFAKPLIKNGSFEDVFVDGVYRPSAIPDWITEGVSGIQPLPDQLESASAGVSRNFADNGLTPHGKYVGFLQCLAYSHENDKRDAVDARFIQVMSGFEPSKSYVVQFFINKNTGGTPPNLYVIFDNTNISEVYGFGSVEGKGSFTKPYRRIITREFKAKTNDNLLLSFILEGKRAEPPAQVKDQWNSVPEPANSGRRAGGVMLLDDVRIFELGDLKLQKARRTFSNHEEVTATFSSKIDPETATNLLNYTVSGGGRVFEAKLRPDEKTVVLRTSFIDDNSATTLSVQGILDQQGNAMFRTNSINVPISTDRYLPWEFTNGVSGFEDDFRLAGRDPSWLVAGDDVFTVADGILTIRPGGSNPSYLLYNAEYNRNAQSVLARVRFRNWTSGDPVGVAALVDPATKSGASAGPTASNPRSLQVDYGASTKKEATSATEGGWYWLRLTATNGTEVAGALWADDPDVPEPAPTVLAGSGMSGLAGIRAATLNPEAVWEIDYILIEADGLPMINPSLPKPPLPRLSITVDGTDVLVGWTQTEAWTPQQSIDLGIPFGDEGEPFEEPLGSGHFFIRVPATDPARFFRLRQ